MNIIIRLLASQEVRPLGSAFAGTVWKDITLTLERYLAEQEKGERVVLVAFLDGDFAGFVTIRWKSDYPSFAEKSIPEISDLRVLPAFRRRGIGTALVSQAEKRIFERSPVAGISVGMYADYGPAQRMYALRGYVPDGLGLVYKGQNIEPGQEVTVDDNLVLYLTKEIRKEG